VSLGQLRERLIARKSVVFPIIKAQKEVFIFAVPPGAAGKRLLLLERATNLCLEPLQSASFAGLRGRLVGFAVKKAELICIPHDEVAKPLM